MDAKELKQHFRRLFRWLGFAGIIFEIFDSNRKAFWDLYLRKSSCCCFLALGDFAFVDKDY